MKPSRLLSLAALAVGALAAPAAAQQFTFKISSPVINDSTHEYMKTLKAAVEQRSGGKIKVEMYPANQLGQIPTTVEGVALGTIEMTTPAIGFYIGIEPRFQTLETTGLFDSMEHAQKVLADPDIRKRLSTFGEAKGVEPLFTIAHGELVLVSAKPIRTLAEMKGLKIRVPGAAPLHTEPFKRVGVSPVSMPLGEALPALQNKAIDAAAITYPVAMAFKYHDISKSATRVPGGYTIVSGVVNRRYMKSLGPELEKILREESQKAEKVFWDWGFKEHARVKEAWGKTGAESINFSPDDVKKYQAEVDAVVAGVVAGNAKMKEDYDALKAAAKKHR